MRISFILILLLVWGGSFAQFRFLGPEVRHEGQKMQDAWAGGLDACAVYPFDLDKDGKDDLLLYDRSANRLRAFVYRDDQWRHSPYHESLFPQEKMYGWVVVEDFDGDGKKDLFLKSVLGIGVYRQTDSQQPFGFELVQDPVYAQGEIQQINIQVASQDIPGIVDVDMDGDLDILVYNFNVGEDIRWYKNFSMENSGKPGIEMKLFDGRWGDFKECDCGLFSYNNEQCGPEGNSGARLQHIGGKSLHWEDIDNDGDLDLWSGQEQCPELYFLENKGIASQAAIKDFTLPYNEYFPEGFLYPTIGFVDLNRDGKKDKVIGTNIDDGQGTEIDFSQSIFRVSGTGIQPFLQNQMIDLGEQAIPCVWDVDEDGDMDLLVSYKKFGVCALARFENEGSQQEPLFVWKEDDFFGLRKKAYTSLVPLCADWNGDGADELQLLTSRSKNPFSALQLTVPQTLQSADLPIRRIEQAAVLDWDGNGKTDLFAVNLQEGIRRYERQYSGEWKEEASPFEELKGKGYISMAFFQDGPLMRLFFSDGQGALWQYSWDGKQLVENGPALASDVFGGAVFPLRFSDRSYLHAAVVRQGKPASILAGTNEGGLHFLQFDDQFQEGLHLSVFPNPLSAGQRLVIQTHVGADIQIADARGRLLRSFVVKTGSEGLFLGQEASGVYFVCAEWKGMKIVKPLVVYK